MSPLILLVSLVAIIVSGSNADETPKTLSTKGLWARYRAELFDFLRAGDADALPGLQLVTTPFPAEWDQNPQLLQDIVSRIPQWGPSWALTNTDFRDSYEDFLTNIKLPAQPKKDFSKLEKIEDQLFELEMKMGMEMQKCMQRYAQHQAMYSKYMDAGHTKTFPEYKQIFCSSLMRAESAITNKRGELLVAQVEMRDNYYDARAALGKFSVTPDSQKTFNAYGSLSRFAQAAEMGQVNGFEVKITSKTSSSSRSTTTQSMGIGFDGAFFSVPVSASLNMGKEEMKFKSSESEFQLLFGAKGYMSIPVFPDRSWYAPEIVKKYANGPFRKPKTYFYDVSRKSFPKNAKMPMVVKTLFVVVGPTVEMYVTKSDAEELQKKSTFGASFSVAGISFDFSKGSELHKTDETSKLSKVTITGASATPQLLAVESQILPQ